MMVMGSRDVAGQGCGSRGRKAEASTAAMEGTRVGGWGMQHSSSAMQARMQPPLHLPPPLPASSALDLKTQRWGPDWSSGGSVVGPQA